MEPKFRRSFTDDIRLYHYSPADFTPTFQYLYAHREDKAISMVLNNLDPGKPEKLEFHIVGATESPVTTVKWIWGKLHFDGPYDYDLTFDYLDGKLVQIIAANSPKSLPVEEMAKRTQKVRYPAEVTAYDIFSPTEKDEEEEPKG